MKTDQQLEDLLRATFAARSETVSDEPSWSDPASTTSDPYRAGDTEFVTISPRVRHRRYVPLAAAVLVALAVTGILVGTQAADDRATPARPNPPATVTQRAACIATDRAQWQHALTRSTHVVGDDQAVRVVGLTSDGTAVGTQLQMGQDTSRLTIGTVSFATNRFRPLTSISGQTRHSVETSVQVADGHAVVEVNFDADRPQSSAPDQVVLVDIASGGQTELMSPRGAHPSTSDLAVIFDGAVYWDEYPAGDTKREVVHEYTIATRGARVVYDGPALVATPRFGDGLGFSAAGVWWTGTALRPDRAARLPAAVARNTRSEIARGSLRTDGTSYAWRTATALGWWAPGRGVVEVRTSASFVSAVAGPLVFFRAADNSPVRVLDARTATIVTVSADVPMLAASAGVAVFGSDASTSLVRLDTATLAPLRCR